MRLSTFTSCNLCLFVAAEQCVCKFVFLQKETCICDLVSVINHFSGQYFPLKNWKKSLKWIWLELRPVVMNVKECYTVRKQTIRVLLRSFFQGWNKLNMSYHVSKYFSCVSNVSIICKPVRVFLSKWQPWLFVPAYKLWRGKLVSHQ